METQSAPVPIKGQSGSDQDSPNTLTRHGLTIRKRHGRQDEKWTTRIRFRGKVHHLTLAETAKDAFEVAIRARREIHAGRWAELRQATALRQVHTTTLGQLYTVYRKFTGPDRPAARSLKLNIAALNGILAVVHPDVDPETFSLGRLTRELLWAWKEKKRAQATAPANDDTRTLQILRSANSRLRQARSLFATKENLRNFYRHHQITLPDSIAGFKAEPPFGACSKRDYHVPSDVIIARTFAALEELGKSQSDSDLNIFKACWLALGFGLRAGEIGKACNHWFETSGGIVTIRGDRLAKNKQFPEVRCQLGAWDHLRKHIEKEDPAAFVITGNAGERTYAVFLRVSEWMRSLGWETTHQIHELRAWAGCQIAMAPGGRGLLDAQVFMRHSHYQTTEKYYGHHIKIRLKEVQLILPAVEPPKPFEPKILPAATAS